MSKYSQPLRVVKSSFVLESYSFWGKSFQYYFAAIMKQAEDYRGIPGAAVITYITSTGLAIRWIKQNHLYNLVHRGYTAQPGGIAECPFTFYQTWVNDPQMAKAISERMTRKTDDPSQAFQDSGVVPKRDLANSLASPKP